MMATNYSINTVSCNPLLDTVSYLGFALHAKSFISSMDICKVDKASHTVVSTRDNLCPLLSCCPSCCRLSLVWYSIIPTKPTCTVG
jgi:hypothetical protein